MIIKNPKQANNFILGYLIFFISSIFIPYYFSVFSVMIVAIFNELYDIWKSDKDDYKFDLVNIGHTIAGMIPALLLKIIGNG
jgi:predicted membrane protein